MLVRPSRRGWFEARSQARGALLALALAAISLGACFSPSSQRQDDLTRVTVAFTDGMRWGRFDEIAAYLTEQDARLYNERLSALGEDFAMADAEITSVRLHDGATKATVTADVVWYNQRRALVRKATLEQHWEWKGSRWVCVEQRRLRGDRFPLVPEPLAAVADPAPRPPAP